MAQQLFEEKMVGMEVSQMGMCDGLRTTLIIYRSKDGRVAQEFVGFSGTRYVAIREAGDLGVTKKHYFTKHDENVVQNEDGVNWGNPLMRDGPNLFRYYFFQHSTDCGLSASMK